MMDDFLPKRVPREPQSLPRLNVGGSVRCEVTNPTTASTRVPWVGPPTLAERKSGPWNVPGLWPLLGREAELSYLAANIAREAFAGVVLVGDAGVG